MMRDNPRFKKHCTMLEGAITALPDVVQVRGMELLDEMKSRAKLLDEFLDPTVNGEATMGNIIQIREDFQTSCKNMYSWAEAHLPALNFN